MVIFKVHYNTKLSYFLLQASVSTALRPVLWLKFVAFQFEWLDETLWEQKLCLWMGCYYN